METIHAPKAVIGLGNPGAQYAKTRHNIGFIILDALAQAYNVHWRTKDNLEYASVTINNQPVLLIKPQTFMNNSGAIVPFLTKQGIKSGDVLIVHDELELPFGKLAIRLSGSAKGHNGLKSFIAAWGDQFARLRFGIGRPNNREDVPHYVLQNFSQNPEELINLINQSLTLIENLYCRQ